MTYDQIIDYAQNPGKIYVTQLSTSHNIPVRHKASHISKTVQSSYLMGVKHSLDRIEINFMAGVDNATTLQEFKDWIKELKDGNS